MALPEKAEQHRCSPSAACNDCRTNQTARTAITRRNTDHGQQSHRPERRPRHHPSLEGSAALARPARRSLKDVLAAMPDVGTDDDFNVRQG
jgi:hypothetical protein